MLYLLFQSLILLAGCLLVSKTIIDGFNDRCFMQKYGKRFKDPKTGKYRNVDRRIERKKQPVFYWSQMIFMLLLLFGFVLTMAPDVAQGWKDFFS